MTFQMKKLSVLSLVVATVASAILYSCGSAPKEGAEDEMMTEEVVEIPTETPKTVVDIAVGSPNHTTLVAAVSAAGLVETLNGAGPFTIFAPTNRAFAALPEGTVESLLLPENKDQLTGILTYHVVAGNVIAADLSDGQVVPTLNGQELTVSIADGKVSINGATVTVADLLGTNGVIHVIDTVILPE